MATYPKDHNEYKTKTTLHLNNTQKQIQTHPKKHLRVLKWKIQTDLSTLRCSGGDIKFCW